MKSVARHYEPLTEWRFEAGWNVQAVLAIARSISADYSVQKTVLFFFLLLNIQQKMSSGGSIPPNFKPLDGSNWPSSDRNLRALLTLQNLNYYIEEQPQRDPSMSRSSKTEAKEAQTTARRLMNVITSFKRSMRRRKGANR